MNEKLEDILEHKLTVPVVVGILSLGIGAVGGYLLGKRNGDVFIVVGLDETVSEEANPDQGTLDLESVPGYIAEHAPRVAPPVQEYPVEEEPENPPVGGGIRDEGETAQVHETEPEVVDEAPADGTEPVPMHIFDLGDGIQDFWSYEEEEKTRTPEAPYVLHKDEFYGNEREYMQTTLTYYQGDDIMTDQDDSPIYNYANTVGELKFGHGSGDPNVFHVRNDKQHAEYEVVFDPGTYSKEVLGLDEVEEVPDERELRHSGVRRFRQED